MDENGYPLSTIALEPWQEKARCDTLAALYWFNLVPGNVRNELRRFADRRWRTWKNVRRWRTYPGSMPAWRGSYPVLFLHVAPTFLEEVCAMRSESKKPRLAFQVRDTIEMCRLLNDGELRLPPIRSVAQLHGLQIPWSVIWPALN